MKIKHYLRLKLIFNSLLVLLLVLSGCVNTAPRIALISGEFESEQVSLLRVGYAQFVQKRIFVKNNQLSLKAVDTTFKLNTCGNLITGRFYTKNDSLVLLVFQNNKKLDSTLFSSSFIPLDTIYYHVKDQETLTRTWILKSGRFRGYTNEDCLKKKSN